MTTTTGATTATPITRPTAVIRPRITNRRREAAHDECQCQTRSNHDDALCDGDGGGSLGLRLCPCTGAHERLTAAGAWHDVAAWHSQCASRAHWNSHGRDRTRNPRRQSEHIRRLAIDRRDMRRRFNGASICCHGKSDDGSVCWHGRLDDGTIRRRGKLDAGTVRHRALRRGWYDRNRGRDLCRVCDGIFAIGLVDGSRVIRRHGWNSAGLYRTGRRRPQPPIRGSEPEFLGARDELPDASQRHDPALDSIGIGGAEHTHMRKHPERCSYDRRCPDDVRSAFDRPSLEPGGHALPLTILKREAPSVGACSLWNPKQLPDSNVRVTAMPALITFVRSTARKISACKRS